MSKELISKPINKKTKKTMTDLNDDERTWISEKELHEIIMEGIDDERPYAWHEKFWKD